MDRLPCVQSPARPPLQVLCICNADNTYDGAVFIVYAQWRVFDSDHVADSDLMAKTSLPSPRSFKLDFFSGCCRVWLQYLAFVSLSETLWQRAWTVLCRVH